MGQAPQRDNPCLLPAALLSVVLLAVNAPARVPGMVAQVVPFALRDDAVRFRCGLVPVQAHLLALEISSLGYGQLAGAQALLDARALILLRVVKSRGISRTGENRHREERREDQGFT